MQNYYHYWGNSSLRSWHLVFLNNLRIISIVSILCLAQPAQANSNWMLDRDYVKLVQQDVSRPNDHPQIISPEAIRIALSALQINSKKGKNQYFSFDGDKSIFDDSTLDRLDKPLADLLSQAKSDEDIVFHLTSRHSRLIGGNNLITTARVFYVDGHLNFIFGEIHADLKKKFIRSGGDTRVNQRITKSELRDFHLKTGSRENYNKNINLSVMNGLGETLNNRSDWAAIDMDNLTATPAIIKKDNVNSSAVRETLPQDALSDKASIEKRLIHLKDLYKKGIITENAYNKKMQDILNEL